MPRPLSPLTAGQFGFPALLPLLALLVFLAGCGEQREPAPSMADSPDAATVGREIDADLRTMNGLPPEQRAAAELAFGPRLRRDLAACRGTRHENKPLYMLAQWTLVHGGEQAPNEVLHLVDRLDLLPAPAYRKAGQALRVMALLRLGRLAEAKPIAAQLDQELPEFGVQSWVEFHEQVGRPAPPLPGIVVAGSAEIPASAFLLITFLGMPDAAAEAWLTPLKAAAGTRVHTLVVTTSGDMLAAATVSSAWGVEVRWLRQGDAALAAWHLPSVPTSVLLGPGPERTILAVDVQVGQLQRLGAKAP